MELSNEFLDAKRKKGDPLADDTLDLILSKGGWESAKRFFEQLIRQVELPIDQFPVEAKEFLRQTNHLPHWANENKIKQAHALFLDHGPKMLVFLYFKSLPLLYTNAKGALVLIKTGRLTKREQKTALFTRRIAETAQFLLTVMAKDSLRPSGPGIRMTQKIRLIHASIRKFMPHDWASEENGVPINQEDMALTLMTFSVCLTDALAQFGIEESSELVEGYIHCWNAIGYVLGIDEDLLPNNATEARTLLNTILRRQSQASEEGQHLTEALVGFSRDVLPQRPFFQKIPPLLIDFLIGREKARMLGVNPPMGCLGIALPEILGRILQLGESLEDKANDDLRALLNEVSRQLTLRMFGFFDNYKGQRFAMPSEYIKEWHLN